MSWASATIEKLIKGGTAKFRPKGNSMIGYINSGQLVTLESAEDFNLDDLKIHDIVLCRVKGKDYLHLIKSIRREKGQLIRFQIGNARGEINGWANRIFGRVIKIED